jgi:HEAT repeat protein
MPSLSDRIAMLRRGGRAPREAALLEAITWAGEAEADTLVIEALECLRTSRDPKHLLLTTLSAWPRLGTLVRDAVLSAAGDDLDELVGGMAHAERSAARTAAAVLSCDILLGPRQPSVERRRAVGSVLQTLVIDADADVALAARDAVARACDHAAESPENHAPALLEDPLEKALVAALSGYVEHRHNAVIATALKVAHAPGTALRKWLAHDNEPGHMALRAAARRMNPDHAIPRLIAWLAIPALAPVAAEWAELGGSMSQSKLLASAHLLTLRGRAHALRRVRSVEKLLPSDARLAEDPAPLRRGSIRLARLVARPERRLLHVSGFLADPDPEARMDAVGALGQEPPGRLVDDALTDFTLDPCPEVSAMAACVLASAQSPARRRTVIPCFRTLLRSPHAPTRTLADLVLREFDPFAPTERDRLWDHAVPAARAAGTSDLERQRFVEEAVEQLRSGPARQRVGVLSTIARLRLIPHVFDELVALVGDKDQRVGAKAVNLLGRSGDPRAARVLRTATNHPDPRTRAEAVEGLWRLQPADQPTDFTVWLDDETPRVRANAARAVLGIDPPQALRTVEAMLRDERAAHRASGLWLAEVGGGNGGLVELTSLVVDLARVESDPIAQCRAKRCAARLIAKSRLMWTHQGIGFAADSGMDRFDAEHTEHTEHAEPRSALEAQGGTR